MEPTDYMPPTKAQIIKDLIPCRTSISARSATFEYSTEELRNQAEALVLLMNVPVDYRGEYLSGQYRYFIEIKIENLR